MSPVLEQHRDLVDQIADFCADIEISNIPADDCAESILKHMLSLGWLPPAPATGHASYEDAVEAIERAAQREAELARACWQTKDNDTGMKHHQEQMRLCRGAHYLRVAAAKILIERNG